jgi:uncharacterized protein YecT (DUF1311 family)
MLLRICAASFLFLAVVCAGARAADAEPERRKWDGAPGYSVFGETISPNGAYVLAWGSPGLAAEDQAKLKEWAPDLGIMEDGPEFDNFLLDARKGKVLATVPGFAFFSGHGYRKNHRELYVAWTPDSRGALAVYEGRWDDEEIFWMDPVAKTFVSVKDEMNKAYGRLLKAKEKHARPADVQFQYPVALGNNEVVVDAWSQIPKEDDPVYSYRLKFRFTPGKGGKVRCELVDGHRTPADMPGRLEEEATLTALFQRLKAKVPAKARAALEREQDAWKKWRDAQPENARERLTAQRGALLHARAEWGAAVE